HHYFPFSRSAPTRPLHPFPARRSSDLLAAGRYRYRLTGGPLPRVIARDDYLITAVGDTAVVRLVLSRQETADEVVFETAAGYWRDRKSTRLNSSHVAISYAVLCLKKKR